MSAQLADARGTTTAKLDAPVNKLARLLNSPSIKRVLLNDSLQVDFDQVIAGGEVLVVKGALGAMGAGNTSVLMQLLVGMLDAALARSQDGVVAERRTAVALKVDEAPLVLNRGFAETMALKRSAGLETVACWQTDAQWTDRDIRAQLDALFAHRVYFATASVEDARKAASLMMADFSDVVRPDVRNLSELGRPNARLRLPRHSAIASWVTLEGRQAPFVAHTLPLSVDDQRLALHAARQSERGGRYCEDLSQPHWERGRQADGRSDKSAKVARSPADGGVADDDNPPSSPTHPQSTSAPASPQMASMSRSPNAPDSPPAGANPMLAGVPSSTPAESYRELVDLSAAHSVRWAKPSTALLELTPEPLDLEILALIASMRHLLSSQIHRRFNPTRAATTTQRRLKRLSDAGLVARFQFHRRDGGGVPMCYTITPVALRLLAEHGRSIAPEILAGVSPHQRDPSIPKSSPTTGERLLLQARHDVRAAGWAFAVEGALDEPLELAGPLESITSPPPAPRSSSRATLSPSDLRLPGGRTPHDFLRTLAHVRVEVESFQSIRPDITLRSKRGGELLVELDDRLPEGLGAAKLERYDHFLAGWSTHIHRYARPGAEPPHVVFVCRDRSRARECARRADTVLTSSRAYPGEYPSQWDYPGRERIVFAAERDSHERLLCAWGVPPLPPQVRVAVAAGDPRAREPLVELRRIRLTAGRSSDRSSD